MKRTVLRLLTAFTLALTATTHALAAEPAAITPPAKWQSLIDPEDLASQLQSEAKPVIIDVRSSDEYEKGHIPGAINLPGNDWRTPSTKPSKGASQDIFLKKDGSPDVERYEKLLGDAGLTRTTPVVVYGSHAGKADSTVPAMILAWLGQERVAFLDGVGLDRWKAAGFEVETKKHKLPKAEYDAKPAEDFLWSLEDVVGRIGSDDVVFYDTRSPREFSGEDLRDNTHGGHIPGAVLINYEDFLTKDQKTVLPPAEVAKTLADKQVTPDKTVVLYCQTATRVSLPYLALKDLGFEKVAIYDASWHEYGNRDDTPKVKPEAAKPSDAKAE